MSCKNGNMGSKDSNGDQGIMITMVIILVLVVLAIVMTGIVVPEVG